VSDRPDSAGVRIPPPLVFLGALGIGFLADRLAPWPIGGTAAFLTLLRRIGIVLAASGLALDVWSVVLFRRAGTNPLPFRPSTAFVARGPYRFTRNPMYLGMTLLIGGVGLWSARAWIALSALLGAAVIHLYAIPREERYLERTFGESYRDYRRRVRRWV
jgi:protein-S-isoprenylcysteine O-methyltransferase Ste14